MNILILGAAGFIGKNLTLKLMQDEKNRLTLVDRSKAFFSDVKSSFRGNIIIREAAFLESSDFESLLTGQDIVYHLVSTTVPVTSNQHISQELKANVLVTVNLLDACVRCGIRKVVFFSSGGTIYGKGAVCPIQEETPAYPICSYGLQKMSIERLLHLYRHMYGLDYRIIRLSNPYGPYQRPNGILGAVTTFTYKALKGEEIHVYGDGTVIRDFIYIEDAVRAVFNIVEGESEERIFNVGCGYGTSIHLLLEIVRTALKKELKIVYEAGRAVDVPENYLDISRYEKHYGSLNPISLKDGICKTAAFIKEEYKL